MRGILAVAVTGAFLAGCGTIVRGTEEDVVIDVQPPEATVMTSLGLTCVGPCVLQVKRKQDFTVTASAPGYDPQTVAVGTRISGGGAAGLAGNVVFGGLIGVGVDAATGASLDHFPNPVVIRLQPSGPGPTREKAQQGIPIS